MLTKESDSPGHLIQGAGTDQRRRTGCTEGSNHVIAKTLAMPK